MANFVNDVGALQQALHLGDRARVRGRRRARAARPRRCCASWTRPSWRSTSPRTTALATAYLDSGADRRAYQADGRVTACKFQDDPHNQKITHSTFEEYGQNSTHLRDRLLLATARLLAGWPKMPGERDCYARFMKEWINN